MHQVQVRSPPGGADPAQAGARLSGGDGQHHGGREEGADDPEPGRHEESDQCPAVVLHGLRGRDGGQRLHLHRPAAQVGHHQHRQLGPQRGLQHRLLQHPAAQDRERWSESGWVS